MLISTARFTVIMFGVFLIVVGIIMLFAPLKARAFLMKAGSTNLINYTEITLRMIPAAALILAADISKFPGAFKLLGWYMLATSLVLFFVPRKLHHKFALKSANVLRPILMRLVAPLGLLFGSWLIYSVE